ncbi:zinc-ribbon domain-containing protein [Streptomyces griseoviridis]
MDHRRWRSTGAGPSAPMRGIQPHGRPSADRARCQWQVINVEAVSSTRPDRQGRRGRHCMSSEEPGTSGPQKDDMGRTDGAPTDSWPPARLRVEFVASTTKPGRALEDLHPGSSDRCLWRCAAYGHEWHAMVSYRARRGGGCPTCRWMNDWWCRMGVPAGTTVAQLRPDLVDELVENLTRPERSLAAMPPGLDDECRWRCPNPGCQHEWPTRVSVRVKGSNCPKCARKLTGQKVRRPRPGGSVAELHPHLEREFVANLTRPEHGLTDIRPASGDQCQWRCAKPSCGHEWMARMSARTRKKASGCPECGERLAAELVTQRRTTPPEGGSLAIRHPEIAKEFVANLTRPGHTPELIRPGSRDRCRWRDASGRQWEAVVKERTRSPTRGLLLKAHGQSRFEYEIAALITAASGLQVEKDVRIDVPGQARALRVDLWLPEIRQLVELDPARWHHTPASAVRDQRKSELLTEAGHRVIRLRSDTMASIAAESLPVHGSAPWNWAQALAPLILEAGKPWTELSSAQVAEIIGEAAQAWTKTVTVGPIPNALDTAPHLADEFVANLTHPGLDLIWLAPGSSDRCQWICAVCRHEWGTSILNRTQGTGCPRCARGQQSARVHQLARPRPGHSLADVHPTIAEQFVTNLTHPQFGTEYVKPGSGDLCQWRCALGHEWTATVSQRVRAVGTGCRLCYQSGAGKRNQKPRPGKSLADLYPQAAAELVLVLDDPQATASDLRPGSKRQCRWRCAAGHGEWETTPNSRTGAHKSGCPQCGRERTRQSRRTPAAGGSLLDQHPDIAAEFLTNLSRPGTVPADMRPGSNDRCLWRCPKGHEWETITRTRTKPNGTGCPDCVPQSSRKGRQRPPTGGSLIDRFPGVAAELVSVLDDPEATAADVRYGSVRVCRWRCTAAGHEWEAPPMVRTTRGRGCPHCRSMARGSRTPSPDEGAGALSD